MKNVLAAGRHAAKWTAYAGLACGVVYAVGGFFYDLATIGLNGGTALAFLALVGMPALFGAVGFVAGVLGAAVVHGIAALVARIRSPD